MRKIDLEISLKFYEKFNYMFLVEFLDLNFKGNKRTNVNTKVEGTI